MSTIGDILLRGTQWAGFLLPSVVEMTDTVVYLTLLNSWGLCIYSFSMFALPFILSIASICLLFSHGGLGEGISSSPRGNTDTVHIARHSIGHTEWIFEDNPQEHFISRQIPDEIIRLPYLSLIAFRSPGVYVHVDTIAESRVNIDSGGSWRTITVIEPSSSPTKSPFHSSQSPENIITDIYGSRGIIGTGEILDMLGLLEKMPDIFPNGGHIFGHTLGHHALDLAGFARAFSWVKSEDTGVNNAVSGYLHGIVEEFVTENPKILKDPESLCREFYTGSLLQSNCAHGLGHGAMLIEKRNITRAIRICDRITLPKARDECFGGIWMELFSGEPAHAGVSELGWDKENPLLSCQKAEKDQKPYCYFYLYLASYRYHPTGYPSGLISLCQTKDVLWNDGQYCFKGIGRGYRGRSFEVLERIAKDFSPREKYAFYRGFASHATQGTCSTFTSDRPICERAMVSQRQAIHSILMSEEESREGEE